MRHLTFQSDLERQLRAVQEQLAPQHRKSGGRRRLRVGAIVAAVAVASSATTLAAVRPWEPSLGDPTKPETPQATSTSVPASQRQLLGVLRRPQTAADRGPYVTDVLSHYLGASATGIRTNDIRLLTDATDQSPQAILIPAAHFRFSATMPGSPEFADALCLWVPDPQGGGAKQCSRTSDITAGEAYVRLGGQTSGLVPDGVSAVRAGTTTAPVASNFFQITADPSEIKWLNTAGDVVGPRR